MVVVLHPVIQPLTGIGKRGKHRFAQKFMPDRLPETLDLTKRHRVMGSTTDMPDSLLFEHLLEARLTSPVHKLPAVVRQDLTWRTPLAKRALGYLKHSRCRLLAEEAPAHQIPRVVIDDPHQVDPVEAF